MERKAYLGCCTLDKEIEPSFRVNECVELEKASEVQGGEGGNETVMKGGNIETVTHSQNAEIMENYIKRKKALFFYTLQRNCVEFTTTQEVIKNYWAENRTEENGLSCQDWHGQLERKLFPSNLTFILSL